MKAQIMILTFVIIICACNVKKQEKPATVIIKQEIIVVDSTPTYQPSNRYNNHYSNNGGKCQVCPYGRYENGICNFCGLVSHQEAYKHRQQWNDAVEQDPTYYGDYYSCPRCNGIGCRKCNYIGKLTPY